MRAPLLLLLMLVGCSAPPRHRPQVPAPPVLDPVERLQRARIFLLRGNVVPDVAVRLYADSACAGPVYLQTTGVALREGVQVELIRGVDNVFSADALSGEGGVSVCSSSIVMNYLPLMPPGEPTVTLTPPSPSAARLFTLTGAIDGFARAQLHLGDCSGVVIAELDPQAFFSPGFVVEAPLNDSRTIGVDAIDDDLRSTCVLVTVTNDLVPPVFQARLASPTPTSNAAGFIVLTGEPVFAFVSDGPDCGGPWASYCAYCTGGTPFSPATTQFSVLGYDEAGNSNCASGSKPWAFDGSLSPEQAIVLLPGTPPQAEVPVGLAVVRGFDSNDCSGPVMVLQSPYSVANYGLFVNSMVSGFVTAQGERPDGGLDPCSNAVMVR